MGARCECCNVLPSLPRGRISLQLLLLATNLSGNPTLVEGFCRPGIGCLSQLVSTRVPSCLASRKDNSDEEKRMAMVRQLQKTFYQSGRDHEDRPVLEDSTGRISNLPMWRVGWVELPGRANCLNVHEGHYTNMFEKIVSRDKPWYFGHLHLPGGTKASRTGEQRSELKSWKEELKDEKRFDEPERSAVVGVLMRITDYRRLSDGRLLILVHALERFVVDKVVQTFPHGVAHVQILPDTDHLHASPIDVNVGSVRRAAAVKCSFRFHDYESDSIPLPLPHDTEYMSTQQVFGSAIADCLPFAKFAKNDTMLADINESTVSVGDNGNEENSFAGGEPLLETQLQAGLILRNPPPISGVLSQAALDTDALERSIWLALGDFCRNTSFVLPGEILCLKPPSMKDLELGSPPKQELSKKYPNDRRQMLLSYHLPALIENVELGMNIRQVFLNTPTTQARLAAFLERFQVIADDVMGQFE